MKREPAITVGTVSAAVAAILALLVAFGLDVTEEQQTAILGVVAALGPIVAGVLIRGKVSPVDVDAPVDEDAATDDILDA